MSDPHIDPTGYLDADGKPPLAAASGCLKGLALIAASAVLALAAFAYWMTHL